MTEVAHSFRAMNTDVQAIVVADGETSTAQLALRDVEQLFATVESKLSRFRSNSDLTRLNSQSGAPFRASALLFEVTSAAIAAARETGGLFDPTVLGALVAAGYDQSFETLPRDRPGDSVSPWNRQPHWQDVRLDPIAREITLPRGIGLDLGGIGKGWTVDRAVERLSGFSRFGIDAGGDIYCRGRQKNGEFWTVGVEDPRSLGCNLVVLEVEDRAVATSTVARRRWRSAGRHRHHLIDPRTGRPAETDVLSATVITRSVARAEMLAKVALILGSEAGLQFLNQFTDASSILVRNDGRVLRTAGFSERLQCVER